MLERINPERTKGWKKLKKHYKKMRSVQMKEMFDADKGRFSKFSIQYVPSLEANLFKLTLC